MSNIDTLLKKISRTREDLLNHKIYLKLNSEEAIAKFMETHVFAVWDFMSLVKALQKELTCVKTPMEFVSAPILFIASKYNSK